MTDLNMDAFWMPFTPNRAFKQAPRMVKSADGVFLTSSDNRRVLDATAGLWCVNAGHCRPEIADAVDKQLRRVGWELGSACILSPN